MPCFVCSLCTSLLWRQDLQSPPLLSNFLLLTFSNPQPTHSRCFWRCRRGSERLGCLSHTTPFFYLSLTHAHHWPAIKAILQTDVDRSAAPTPPTNDRNCLLLPSRSMSAHDDRRLPHLNRTTNKPRRLSTDEWAATLISALKRASMMRRLPTCLAATRTPTATGQPSAIHSDSTCLTRDTPSASSLTERTRVHQHSFCAGGEGKLHYLSTFYLFSLIFPKFSQISMIFYCNLIISEITFVVAIIILIVPSVILQYSIISTFYHKFVGFWYLFQ